MDFKEIDIPIKKTDKKRERWDALAEALRNTSKALEFPCESIQGVGVAMRHRGVPVRVQHLSPGIIAVWKVEER